MKSSIMKFGMSALFLLLGASLAGAATVTVGPSGQYASPCAAFPHLVNGDTVQIDANGGVPYTDSSDCTIASTLKNLTIVGVNGRPILDAANAGIAKGIWVIDGSNIVINNFEFRNANNGSSSTNAAALRIEDGAPGAPSGGNVTVEYCYIHNNDDGILSGNSGDGIGQWASADPFLTFQFDEFADNGYGDGYTHNMYIGSDGYATMKFTLQYSWSHDAFIGNNVKTRAPINNILYNTVSDSYGVSSYILDFPLGGSTYVVGNVLYKAAVTNSNANENMIIWRDENDEGSSDPGYGPANQDLHVINNTVIDASAQAGFSNFFNEECFNSTVSSCPTPPYGPPLTVPGVFENNIFLGEPAQITNDTSALVKNNVLYANTAVTPSSLAVLKFRNAAGLDFHIVAGSPAIGAGIYPPTNNAGTSDPKALAVYQYVDPASKKARSTPTGSTMDAGAYSYPPSAQPKLTLVYTETIASPNTGTITVSGLPAPGSGKFNYAAFLSGNLNAIAYIESAASSTTSVTTTFQAVPVTATTVVPIYIYVDGAVLTASVTVNPGPAVLSSVTLDGAYYPQSTVHLNGPAPSGGAVISLSSSAPSTLYVPSTVTIPSGQLSAETGSINGSLWGQTPTSENATLTATYAGVQKQLVITVLPPFIHNFYCNVFPTCTVVGGQVAPFQLVMAGDYPPGGGNVYFTSDHPSIIPNYTYMVPEGNFNNNINVPTNAVSTSTTVNVTINVNGSTGTAAITVTP
jgi:hypothetical protein